jgi:hypothetical protein
MVWELIHTSESESASADPVVMEFTTITNRFRDGMVARLQQVPVIAGVPAVVAGALTPPGVGLGTLWLVALDLAGILLIGWIAQFIFKKVSGGIPETLSAASDKNFPRRMGRRVALLVYDAFPPVILRERLLFSGVRFSIDVSAQMLNGSASFFRTATFFNRT